MNNHTTEKRRGRTGGAPLVNGIDSTLEPVRDQTGSTTICEDA